MGRHKKQDVEAFKRCKRHVTENEWHLTKDPKIKDIKPSVGGEVQKGVRKARLCKYNRMFLKASVKRGAIRQPRLH